MRLETTKAVEIAKEAGTIALAYFNHDDTAVERKKDGSPLTIADTRIDTYIHERLSRAFPHYSVLSEEGIHDRTTEGVWVVDPIDATENFINGNPHFAVSIGFVIGTVSHIGVVFAPAENKLYVGEREAGSFLNGVPIHVSATPTLATAHILLDPGSHAQTIEKHKTISHMLQREHVSVTGKCCASLDLCSVAAGEYDAYIHQRLKAWDVAAGIAIVEAAGGIVSHLDGSRKDLFQPGIIATAPQLQESILSITKICR